MTTITLEHVSKQFDQITGETKHTVSAVDNVSLKILSGDILAILGPSGCGKSTLLRVVAGLIPPDSGHILYDNVDLSAIEAKDRGIGMVFQDGALMPHWETRRTVSFFYWLRHREEEVPPRVARISQITGFGLDQLLDRRPAHLSGGERQRVAIARALTRDPRVFLFDEPFSNIDAKLWAAARVELKKLLHEFPVTSLYVTHDQVEAVSLAHRIAIMRDGHIEQMGTYHHLYDNPVNLFVAQFIGTPPINVFEGYVVGHHWQGVNFGGYSVRGDLDDGTRVTLGVRAEAVKLVSEGGAGCVVEAVTPHFGERLQWVEVRANAERWTLTVSIDIPIHVGETIRCTLDADSLLFFNPKTGSRIG